MAQHAVVQAASAGVNRRKAADSINEENFAIFRRLQVGRPVLVYGPWH